MRLDPYLPLCEKINSKLIKSPGTENTIGRYKETLPSIGIVKNFLGKKHRKLSQTNEVTRDEFRQSKENNHHRIET